MDIPVLSHWSTSEFCRSNRYEAWSQAVNENYGNWTLEPPVTTRFDARVKATTMDTMKVIECICDPCKAVRDGRNIGQDEGEFLGIQLVLGGREIMRFADDTFSLQSGDVFVWDSTRPMTFDVIEPLHKISLIVPLDRLKSWMPGNWHSIQRKLSSTAANRMLLSSFISTVASDEFGRSAVNGRAISEATIAMLVGGITEKESAEPLSIKHAQLERIQKYIHLHLEDPELSIGTLAQANSISVRYLHWVFGESGTTASQYIVTKRLERCRSDLQNPLMNARCVADIAYANGFSSSAHFSKRYKAQFGEPPSQTRASL
jgi:AraC-like DNA-binding protein